MPESRSRTIIRLGLPIVGGMISQNVLNLVDTAMVGTLGDAALAAVGTGAFLNFLAIAFFMGFGSGVQAMVARRMGEQREDVAAVPLNGALLTIIGATVPWSLFLYTFTDAYFGLINDSPDVLAVGVPYLQARLLALTAVGMNFSFRGFYNGIRRPGLYFRTLLVMHAANIFLNWVFIFGNLGAPELGARGAGIASAISVYLGTITYVFLALTHARQHGFLKAVPDRATFLSTLRLALPTGVQQLFFSAGFNVLFWILGLIGTQATAAANIVINLMLVAILPGIAFGIAGATLVGQALGRKDPDDARQWGWDVVKVAGTLIVLLGLPMLIVPDLILHVFTPDPDTVALARTPLRIFGATLVLDSIGLVLQHALLGAGASRITAIVSIGCQWFLFLPAAYVVGPVLGYGLIGIWIAQAVYRAVQAGLFTSIWARGRWTTIEV